MPMFVAQGPVALPSGSTKLAWNSATIAGFNAALVFSNAEGSGYRTASNPAGATVTNFTRSITASDKNNTGKWYIEFKTDVASGGGRQQLYGIVDNGAANYCLILPSGSPTGHAAGTITWNDTAGTITFATNSVIGWAIDFDNKKAFNSVDGSFAGSQVVSTGTAPNFSWSSLTASCYVQLGLDNTSGTETCTICGSSTNQTYPAPAGYTSWDGV